MPVPIDRELIEALRQLPPLLPKFLQRRRVGLPAVAEIASELQIERSLLFVLLQVDSVQGSYKREGVTLPELQAADPYFVVDRFSQPVAELEERGLLAESSEGILTMSHEARTAMDRLQTEAAAYVAARTVLPDADTRKLAEQLERAVDAMVADPHFAPFPGSHLQGYLSIGRFGDHAAPMVRVEHAIMDLWGARDDAFTATWRAADMEGPPLDVLSQIWSGMSSVEEVAQALKIKQTPGDIESCLAWLVEREYVDRRDDVLSLTPKGVMTREDIENETDKVYFTSWPHTVEDVIWMRDTLGLLVDRLAPPL